MRQSIKAGLCAVAIVLASGAASGQDVPEETTYEGVQLELEVVPVLHAPAEYIGLTLRNVLRTVRITPDDRTNSLIVVGTRQELDTAKQLLASIDVRVDEERMNLPEETGKQVRSYGVQHTQVDQEFLRTLSNLLRTTDYEKSSLQLALDQRQNQVIASGELAYLNALGALVTMLDQPVDTTIDTSTPGELSVRLLWLVGGNTGTSRSVPADVDQVVEELTRYGVEDLKLGAQAMIRVSADDDFSTTFSSSLTTRWTHEVSGRVLTTADGALRLDIDVGAIGDAVPRQGEQPGPIGKQVIEFKTTIHTSAGHFVVLSMSPVGDMDSVYVLQINGTD